jgi:putative salt-induced outer membrane protein
VISGFRRTSGIASRVPPASKTSATPRRRIGLQRRRGNSKLRRIEEEGGAGQSKLIDGTNENEFTGRLSGDYTWTFSENASFTQKLSVTESSSNTFTQSLTELRANVIGALNLVLSYAVQHNSDVLPGTEKTDTYTTISLEYAF